MTVTERDDVPVDRLLRVLTWSPTAASAGMLAAFLPMLDTWSDRAVVAIPSVFLTVWVQRVLVRRP